MGLLKAQISARGRRELNPLRVLWLYMFRPRRTTFAQRCVNKTIQTSQFTIRDCYIQVIPVSFLADEFVEMLHVDPHFFFLPLLLALLRLQGL